VLGFMDGVASCCGEERVIVFTMRGAGKEEEVGAAYMCVCVRMSF
jgi:hypothetical protein